MRLSELKFDAEQTLEELQEYTDAQFFSDDLSSIGGERIVESKLLFHGAFSAKETEEEAKSWSLYLQIVHLGDFWRGYKANPSVEKPARVGFVDSDHHEPDWSLTPNNYVERTGKSGGFPINDNILAIRTENFVVVLHRHWGSNESCQYPENLRGINNELNILRTGGYNLYIFPAEQWDWITKEKNLTEWEEEFLIDDARVIGHWQGFGNI